MMSLPKTAEARPYSVSLAILTASSTLFTRITGFTGPNDSSV